jgi:hypothetical protein
MDKNMIEIYVSIGEILDRISILKIKKEKILDKNKLEKINIELNELEKKVVYDNFLEIKFKNLLEVNKNIWEYEDLIRKSIKNNNFDAIIKNAILICRNNDLRFEIKKEINEKNNSAIQEVKQHIVY